MKLLLLHVVARAHLFFARSNLPHNDGDCFVGKSTLLAMTSIPFEARVIGLRHIDTRDGQTVECADFQTQTKEANEALGMTLVVDILLAKSGEVFAIEAER